MPLLRSWIDGANLPETGFPLNNLPCGVFSRGGGGRRCGVAVGDMILDAAGLEEAGALRPGPGAPVLDRPSWNGFMALGPAAWDAWRSGLQALLAEGADAASREAVGRHLAPMAGAELHMPFEVREYTDFYSGRCHAENVGTILRGPENALPENWLHLPAGYNGRASSVVVSGTPVRRPWGQVRRRGRDRPEHLPSLRFDIELEMGAVVGQPSEGPVSTARAQEMIFGHVLLNDWSARDIQAWEYVPLGPFQAKATATTISPWIVTRAALEPFRRAAPPRETDLLPYLAEEGPSLYDIGLRVSLRPDGGDETVIARTNYAEVHYSFAQQLAHHASAGCPMNVGDLLGSGTISGPERSQRGSLLELSWGGKEPIALDCGGSRTFVEDGDTLTLSGAAEGDGYRIGFGDCAGQVLPALDAADLPYPIAPPGDQPPSETAS